MKRLGFALILTCVLSVSALAGDVPTAGAPTPPPPATQSSTATTILLTILSLIR